MRLATYNDIINERALATSRVSNVEVKITKVNEIYYVGEILHFGEVAKVKSIHICNTRGEADDRMRYKIRELYEASHHLLDLIEKVVL